MKVDSRKRRGCPCGCGRTSSLDVHAKLYADYLITLNALTNLIGVVESVAKEREIEVLFEATRNARESISE